MEFGEILDSHRGNQTCRVQKTRSSNTFITGTVINDMINDMIMSLDLLVPEQFTF